MSSKYGKCWKPIRDKYVLSHPNCELCGFDAEEVHHIIPLSYGGNHNTNNLMSLCSDCHYKIHKYIQEVEKRDIKR